MFIQRIGTFLGVAVAVIFVSCAHSPVDLVRKAERMQASNESEWVQRGTKRVVGANQKIVYFGVGMVEGIKNMSLARRMSESRAKSQILMTMQADYQAFATQAHWAEFLDLLSNEMEIADSWVAPDGKVYTLARLDEDQINKHSIKLLGNHWAVLAPPQPQQISSQSQAQDQPVQETAEEQAKSEAPRTQATSGSIVAVFDIEVVRISFERSFLDGLTDYLVIRLAESGNFQVIPRSAIKERILESKSNSYKQCYDQSCQIELGRELAAEKNLATQIFKIGSKCSVSSALYDLKKATTEIAASETGECDEAGLARSLDQVVLKLVKK